MEEENIDWLRPKLPHQEVGGRSAAVEMRMDMDGVFYLGNYEEYGQKREVKFRSYPNTPQYVYEFNNIVTLSERSKSEFLLVPVVVTKTLDRQHILMGYIFDSTNIDHKGKLFDNDDIMCSHWRSQIWQLFGTMEKMHRAGVYHGKLDLRESYVRRDGHIRIVGPTVDGEMFPEEFKEQLQKLWVDYDIKCFIAFLRSILVVNNPPTDLKLFYDLSKLCLKKKVQCLKNHPLLKDSTQRFNHFRNWNDNCMPQRSIQDYDRTDFKRELKAGLSCYKIWSSRLRDDYLDYYKKPPEYVEPYRGNEVMDFPRYIRNVMKHFIERRTKTVEMIVGDLQRMYPGLLSILHTCVAKLNSESYIIASM